MKQIIILVGTDGDMCYDPALLQLCTLHFKYFIQDCLTGNEQAACILWGPNTRLTSSCPAAVPPTIANATATAGVFRLPFPLLASSSCPIQGEQRGVVGGDLWSPVASMYVVVQGPTWHEAWEPVTQVEDSPHTIRSSTALIYAVCTASVWSCMSTKK